MMSKSLRITLIVLAIVVGAAALLLAGMNIGRAWFSSGGFWSGNMMTGFEQIDPSQPFYGMGSGMMGSYNQGGAYGFMSTNMMGPGMMGSYSVNPLLGIEPLSLPDAEKALEDYLSAVDEDELVIGEIMVFDNHAYAQLIEESSGIGAMEVLIDPVTKAVYPEHGPNMIWNLKYSPMAGSGMMGMMSGFGYWSQYGDMGGMMDPQTTSDLSAEVPVNADEAVVIAQRYLDTYFPGTEADEEADPFYGYYTLHILRDGSTVGMLSVNGYTREVSVHTWHGRLIEMSEDH